MKLLQGGAPKSGNFWLYQLLQQVLTRAGQPPASFIQQQPIYQLAREWELNYPSQAGIDVLDITDLQCSYRISSIFRMPAEPPEAYVAQTDHVWTHSPVCKRSEAVFRLFDKKVYIIRDPRERAVSASRYYTNAYMLKYYPQEERDPQRFLDRNFDALMTEWVWHVFDHLRLAEGSHIHLLFYERLLKDFQRELSALLAYLGLELNTKERAALEQAVRFDTLKRENPNHLRKGRAGQWQEQLSAAQQERAQQLAGPLMHYLGYGRENELPGLQKPALEEELERVKADLAN